MSLRGLLSDELREVNFCRARLGELARAFEEKREDGRPTGAGREAAVPGRSLFPGGCATLDEAAEQVFRGITAEQMAALDERCRR